MHRYTFVSGHLLLRISKQQQYKGWNQRYVIHLLSFCFITDKLACTYSELLTCLEDARSFSFQRNIIKHNFGSSYQ